MGPKRPKSRHLPNLSGFDKMAFGAPKNPIFISKILIIFKRTNAIDRINFRYPSDLIA